MKAINAASAALLVAEREVLGLIDPELDKKDPMAQYPTKCTAEFYGTMARTIKGLSVNNEIEQDPDEPCYQCKKETKTPYMFSRTFCSQKHLDEYENEIDDNQNAMQPIMLSDDDAIRENALMRIALHKLLNLNLTGDAGFAVADVLHSISKDYGEA